MISLRLSGVNCLQWQIQGGARGPRSPYFSTKLRPEGPKFFFLTGQPRPPPPYLRVWMTGPPISQGLDPALVCSLRTQSQ